MPRRARLRIEGLPLHLIQRGNNRTPCFFTEGDYRLYLGLLQELAPRHGCAVHGYVLMTNHVHLLVTPRDALSASMLMKHLGQRYVQYVNRTHLRTGSLWEGRFRSSIVDSDRYFLRCLQYVELNPVRAGLVAHPRDYQWSSHDANALGKPSAIVVPHAEYLALGKDAIERCASYRALLRAGIEERELEEIRSAANGGFALGGAAFISRLEANIGRRAARSESRSRKSLQGEGRAVAEISGLSPVSEGHQELALALPRLQAAVRLG